MLTDMMTDTKKQDSGKKTAILFFMPFSYKNPFFLVGSSTINFPIRLSAEPHILIQNQNPGSKTDWLFWYNNSLGKNHKNPPESIRFPEEWQSLSDIPGWY